MPVYSALSAVFTSGIGINGRNKFMKNKISQFSGLSLAVVAVLAAQLSTASAQSAANLLVNGDFESEPNWGGGVSHDGGYTALTGSQIPGWTIEPGQAVTIHIAPGSYLVISNSFSANTDGEGWNGHNANFYQDFSSTAGISYAFACDWQSWGYIDPPTTNALKISVTDTVTGNGLFAGFYYYDGAGAHPVHHVAANFIGTGNALRLRVEESLESGYNDNTFVVDNFSVVAGPLALLHPVCVGTNFMFSFQTMTSSNYTVECNTDLRTTNWQLLQTITGDGALTQCRVPMTNAAQGFFRVRQP
jgi:hypothetical protein